MNVLNLLLFITNGLLAVNSLCPQFNKLEKIALSYGIGTALISLELFLLLIIKIPPTIISVFSFQILLFLFLLFFALKTGIPVYNSENKDKHPFKWSGFYLFAIVLASLSLLSVLNSVYFPITIGDGIWNQVKANYFIETTNLVYNNFHILPQSNYPLHVPLLYVFLTINQIDSLKIIFPFYYLSLIICFYNRLRISSDLKTAGTFSLVLATTPFIWWHSFLGLLNLTAGYYFSLAVLYCYSSLKETESSSDSLLGCSRYMVLSGILFGFAVWTRLEYFLFFYALLIPLFYMGLNKDYKKLILYLIVPFSGFLCLWFAFFLFPQGLLTDPLYRKETVENHQLLILFIAMWVLYLFYRFIQIKAGNGKKYSVHRLKGFIGVVAAIILIFFIPFEKMRDFELKVLRTCLEQSFWLCTSLILFFPLIKAKKSLSEEQTFIRNVFILFILLHLIMYSYYTSKYPTFGNIDYIKMFIFSPGDLVNLSDTRNLIAFFPLLIFYIGMRYKENRYITIINFIILGNIILLFWVFLWPRLSFIYNHPGYGHREIQLTDGTTDNPNFYKSTYEIVYKILDVTNNESIIFLPPDSDKLHTGPTYQVLHPRKLIWGDEFDIESKMKESLKKANSYFVVNPEWKYYPCLNEIALLNKKGWKICTALPGIDIKNLAKD